MAGGPIPIVRVRGYLLATVQMELHDAVAEAFQTEVLGELERGGADGLLIEVGSIEIVDSWVARVLVDTGRMARLMGVETVLVGMRPEVAATLVRMGYPMQGIRTALDLDLGLALLDEVRATRNE
jgi:rsbT antagonist protein RsbS